jgi:hypothetical protein
LKKFGIDAAPEQALSRSIAGLFKTKCLMVRYNDDQKGAYKYLEDDKGRKEVQVNRTESLDLSNKFFIHGNLLLPRRSEEVEEFAAHSANLVKVLEEDEETGKKGYVYKMLNSGLGTDYRHAFNYACIAAGLDGSQPLNVKGGVTTITADDLYKPSLNRQGKIILGW